MKNLAEITIEDFMQYGYVELRTLGPAYNEFGYYEHPVITSRFFCQKGTRLLDIGV